MRYRSDLEPGAEISTTPVSQEVRDAANVGNGKTGVVFLYISRNAMSAGSATFEILTAADQSAPDLTTNSGWGSAGSTAVTFGTVGLVRFEIGVTSATRMGQWMRWKVTGANAAIQFAMVVFLADT